MSNPTDYFSYDSYHGDSLSCEGVDLAEVAKKVGTPVYVYSEKAFLTHYQRLASGLKGLNHQICFAMKSNSNLAILDLLVKQGAGVDVVSGGELYRASKVGVSAEKIVFSGVGKSVQEIKEGLNYQGKGIYSFNVESLPELRRINEVARSLKKVAPVAFRFNPDVDPKTHPYISTGIKKNKFGMDRNEIKKILSQLQNFSHIRLKGLSVHIGSQLLELSPLSDAFDRLADLVLEISKDLKDPLEFLDLGGGLGISYGREKPVPVSKYCQLIQNKFGAKSEFKGRYKIVLEPGRQISGNAGVLVTQLVYRKERKNQDFLIVDASMGELIRPALYESYHSIVPVQKKLTTGKMKKSFVVGPICESSDFLGKDRELSPNLKEGDLLAILSAGAYGFSMSSQYNSRPQVSEVLVSGKKFRVIRERQKYTDLCKGEKI